ncbi:MAG: putative voltage-gated ClC-type chloride channel ClcB [Acidobacteria bacterium ADurb.Bin340]|nr:MAG: putative voltage-gated ClC-type chloride channel ClcB [Acidobacteria bacterium ADurb.Bin340]HQL48576.1 chloride channel protein [Holophaga sp.]
MVLNRIPGVERAAAGLDRLQAGAKPTGLRLMAQVRQAGLVVLPLGAAVGFVTALALVGLLSLEQRVEAWGLRLHALVLLPAVGMALATVWLSLSKLGTVSLPGDLLRARQDPLGVFGFRTSLGKVLACMLTIAFGGSAGTEGPGKWFGAAVGAQYCRLLRQVARWIPPVRRLLAQPGLMVQAGSAAALTAVFRAPVSGALLAAEHGGDLRADRLVPSLVASASAYLAILPVFGLAPLLPVQGSFSLNAPLLGWALLLGVLCALGARTFQGLQRLLAQPLGRIPLAWRGLVAGLGLVLLALPGAWLWPGLSVTQGTGMGLVLHLLNGTAGLEAWAFLALKLFATALTFAGGGVGGLWLPSIALGAAMGSGLEALVQTGQPGLLVMVGTAAFAAATHRVMLVPVVFLAETTGQAGLVVPALVATVVAFQASRGAD